MAHLLEKSDVAPEHVAPNERLTIDPYQREAPKGRVCGSASHMQFRRCTLGRSDDGRNQTSIPWASDPANGAIA
jgi:hypothetical protein